MDAIRPWLFIGKYRDTRNDSLLDGFGVGAMLQLAEHVPHPRIATLYLEVEDGVPLRPALLLQGMTFVHEARRADQRILIACGAGISRSAAFAAAALKELEQVSLSEALRMVRSCHPEALPHPAIWKSLRSYYGESGPGDSVLDDWV